MRILVVGVSGCVGGIETLFFNLFGEKCDFADVDFLSFGEPCAFAEKYAENGYRNFILPTRKSSPFGFDKKVKEFLKTHDVYDYIWVNTASTSMYQFQYYGKKYTKAKIITHSHGTAMEKTSGSLLHFLNKILARINRRKVTESTDLFFCCSAAAGIALFGEKYRERLFVLHNAIDTEKYTFSPQNREILRRELSVSESDTVLGMIGRLSAHKNVLQGISIFAEYRKTVPESCFFVIGEGELRDAAEALAKDLDVAEGVRFLGFRSDIPQLLSATDILLMPSISEGLPLTAVEAQAAGVRCFLSDTISEEAKLTGLVTFLPLYETAGSWARSIRETYVLPSDRAMFGSEIVKAGYDIKTSREALRAVLCHQGENHG